MDEKGDALEVRPDADASNEAARVDTGEDRTARAARIMFDALTAISQHNAFFNGEKYLKKIAVKALSDVQALPKD